MTPAPDSLSPHGAQRPYSSSGAWLPQTSQRMVNPPNGLFADHAPCSPPTLRAGRRALVAAAGETASLAGRSRGGFGRLWVPARRSAKPGFSPIFEKSCLPGWQVWGSRACAPACSNRAWARVIRVDACARAQAQARPPAPAGVCVRVYISPVQTLEGQRLTQSPSMRARLIYRIK